MDTTTCHCELGGCNMARKAEEDDNKDPEPSSDESNEPDETDIDDDEDMHPDDDTCLEEFEDVDFDCGPDSEG